MFQCFSGPYSSLFDKSSRKKAKYHPLKCELPQRKCDRHLLLRTSHYATAAGAVQSLITAPFDGDQYVGGILGRTDGRTDAAPCLTGDMKN